MKKALSLILALLLAAGLFAGCGNTSSDSGGSTASSAETSSGTTGPTEQEPLAPVVLTMLVAPSAMTDAFTGGDPNKIPYYQIKNKLFNVTIEPIYTTAAESDQKLQLLIASREEPDIMGGIERIYSGGVKKAYDDGVIVRLNEYLDTAAVNFNKVMKQYPEYAKYAKSDDGSVYALGQFRDEEIRCFFGPMIRQDLLDKANLPLPETVDEWYTALTALKGMGVKYPFTTVAWFPGYVSFISSAYGVGYEFYLGEDGKVHFGPLEAGYKAFLETWSKWIKEGLVDANYLLQQDFNAVRGMLASGEAGSSVAFLSFLLQNDNGRASNPDYKLAGTKQPVLEKGQVPLLGQMDPPFTVSNYISARSENIERAIMWFDYNYSEEGHMLANFGVEGVTYNMVDGYPKYTQTLINSIQATVPQEISTDMYVAAAGLIPSYQDKRYFEQLRLTLEEQKDALSKWLDFKIPTAMPVFSFTDEEQKVYAKFTEIKTYVDEMREKFMLGNEPLANYDKFVENVRKMGIDDILTVQNQALDRYNKR